MASLLETHLFNPLRDLRRNPLIRSPEYSSSTFRSTVLSARKASADLIRTIPDEVLAVLPVPLRALLKHPEDPPGILEAISDPATLLTFLFLLATFFVLRRWLSSRNAMSWSSRLPSWGSRFSPWGRTPVSPAEVSESDYSYITASDIDRSAGHAHQASPPPAVSPQEVAGGPDTDVLMLKHRSVAYPVHYARNTISSGRLLVGDIRSMAAKKLSTSQSSSSAPSPIDPRRVNLLYRGQKLTDDDVSARELGFRSGGVHRSNEVLIVLSHHSGAPSADADADPLSAEEDSADPTARKKSRKRRGKKGAAKSRRSGTADATAPAPSAAPSLTNPSIPPASDPEGQLDALSRHFELVLLPLADKFLRDPPADAATRAFDHRRITETILQHVLLKVDGVEVDGREDLRARRKALVKDVQGWLGKLDEVAKL